MSGDGARLTLGAAVLLTVPARLLFASNLTSTGAQTSSLFVVVSGRSELTTLSTAVGLLDLSASVGVGVSGAGGSLDEVASVDAFFAGSDSAAVCPTAFVGEATTVSALLGDS